MELDEKYIDKLLMAVEISDDQRIITLYLTKEVIEKYKDSLKRAYPDVEIKEIPNVFCGS